MPIWKVRLGRSVKCNHSTVHNPLLFYIYLFRFALVPFFPSDITILFSSWRGSAYDILHIATTLFCNRACNVHFLVLRPIALISVCSLKIRPKVHEYDFFKGPFYGMCCASFYWTYFSTNWQNDVTMYFMPQWF